MSAGRHRAASRWCHPEDEGDLVVTVAELLRGNQSLLIWYQELLDRHAHAGQARRITVVPRTTTGNPPPRAAPLGSAQLPAAG